MDIFEKRLLRFLAGYCMLWAATVILSRTVLMLNFIPSGSMEGTIRTGDFVLGTRYDIGEGDIERYDILVFALPDEPDTVYIKRVIGLPGETVVVCDGSVYADGVRLDDSFVKNPMNTKGMALMWYRTAVISLWAITATSQTTAGSGRKSMCRLKMSRGKRSL